MEHECEELKDARFESLSDVWIAWEPVNQRWKLNLSGQGQHRDIAVTYCPFCGKILARYWRDHPYPRRSGVAVVSCVYKEE